MAITQITTDDLRRMEHKEGLVLQGCGGDPQEWLDGINGLFHEINILADGDHFRNAYTFRHEGRTCLLFPFEEAELDVGKLAMWRIQSYDTFGGTWLSDFVPNRLGGFVSQKPKCVLIGEDGNIFHLMGVAARTLRQADRPEQAKEMVSRITQSGSYGEALNIIGEYVEITDWEDVEQSEGMGGMSY